MKGFSIAELLVALTVAGIVTGYAVGNYAPLVAANRQTSQINNLVTSILLARSHAITQHDYVLVCPSENGMSCADSRSWQHGWLVRAAATEGEVLDNTAAHEVLRIHGAVAALTIVANRDYFLFRPFARRATNGTVVFCAERLAVPGKAVIVSYTGRPRVARHRSDGRLVRCDPEQS